MKLTVVGLGVDSGDISVNALEAIKNSQTVILKTEKTRSAEFIKNCGVPFTTLDGVFDKSRNFDTLNKNLAKEVAKYLKSGSVAYLVDGAVSEDESAVMLVKKFGKDAAVYEGVSKSKRLCSLAGISATSLSSFSAYDLSRFSARTLPAVIYDVDSAHMMSEVKLKLAEAVGDEQEVLLYVGYQLKKLKVYELDRGCGFDYSTAVLVDKIELLKKKRFDFDDLVEIVKILRAPGGCPWDRAQTKESVRKHLIEECYELADAIDLDSDEKMLEEIGDVMLQAVFHAVFAEERGAFSAGDVITDECKKLIFRHTHVFGGDKASNADGALDVWDKNKQVEKGFNSPAEYVSDVPKSFPSLLRAEKTLKRIAKNSEKDSNAALDAELIAKIANALNSSGDCASKYLPALLLISADAVRRSGRENEETLYFAVDEIVKAFSESAAAGKGFDLGEYFSRLCNEA